jgi:hypothetical protein
MADEQADAILQQYNQARAYLEQTLEKEAEEKIKNNRRLQDDVEQKIEAYNQAVSGINGCLQGMLLNRHQLPVIGESDLIAIPVPVESNGFDISSNFANSLDLDSVADVIEAEFG